VGHHFVPQAHLRRFECPRKPGSILMYDKVRRTWSQVAIKNAAQARNYYETDVEAGLSETIEGPANLAIEKLLKHQWIDNSSRTSLTLYLLTMATRGPRFRRQTLEKMAPLAIAKVVGEVRTQIEAFGSTPGHEARADALLKELEVIPAKFAKCPPKEILDRARTPFWSEETARAVHNMAWCLVPAPSGRFDLTCDTPAHISEWAGVGTPQSELTFPISKSLALMGSHSAGRPGAFEFLTPQEDLVAEVNRRMVNCAERFVFSHRKESWIATWANSPPSFNRVRWL
jgi:hypothetical protein